MSKMIFVNLPVTDLARAKAFYEALGFTNNAQFSDGDSACMVLSETINVITGVLAMWMSQSPNRTARKWAAVVGLCGQPAWMWTTWHAQQWGIFALTFVYTASWLRGLHTYWWRKQ